MSRAPSLVRVAGGLCVCALALLAPSAAPAQTIDLSLNVFYADPADVDSGGTWEVVAKTSDFGLAGLNVRLTGVSSIIAQEGPRGTVNGDQGAGFSIFAHTMFPGYRSIVVAQQPFDPAGLGPGEEQGIFYGVGTLENGAPNWPDAPPGTNSIGPVFTTLTNVQRVPWAAVGDVFGEANWNTAARLVSGTFATGVTPGFFDGSDGNVFTTLGAGGPTSAGVMSAAAAINTIVRTNFGIVPGGLSGDFNQDGIVDAADYVLWRKNNGSMNGLPNDGGLGVPIGAAHYDLWRANFGETATGSGAALALSVVPEPASAALLALGALLMLVPRRRAGCSPARPVSSTDFSP